MSQTVLVTGGTRGIGKACAKAFLEKGNRVIALYKNDENSALDFLKDMTGYDLKCIKCDVSDYAKTKECIENILKEYSHIDILVNNAGISYQALLCDTKREDWDKVFNVNIGSMYNTVNILYDSFVSAKWGRIINISSMWGVSGASCEVAYSASKSAVIGFTKALSKELGPSGITVNCVAPGLIDTSMNSHLTKEDIESLVECTPLCRIGKSEDVASLVLYLASEDASFITGQVINVDGGFLN